MRNNLLKLGAAMSAVVMGGYTAANAVPTLTLFDGTTSVTVLDGGAGDAAPGTAGQVLYSGGFGVWNIIVTTGISKPQGGFSAINPGLDLSFILTSTGAGNLTMTWSDTDFGPASGNFNASIGGTFATTGGSAAFTTYYDPANLVPATTLLTAEQDYSGSSNFGGSGSASVGSLNYPFSLSEVVKITHNGIGVSSGDATITTAVPDAGSTLMLLGTAMSLLGVYGRSRRNK
jgi:hypothetical protein